MDNNSTFDVKVFQLSKPLEAEGKITGKSQRAMAGSHWLKFVKKKPHPYESKSSKELEQEIKAWLQQEDPRNIKNPLVIGGNLFVFYEKRFNPQG